MKRRMPGMANRNRTISVIGNQARARREAKVGGREATIFLVPKLSPRFLLVPKLRLGTPLSETPFRVRARNGVSSTDAPKRSLGTRGTSVTREDYLTNPRCRKYVSTSRSNG